MVSGMSRPATDPALDLAAVRDALRSFIRHAAEVWKSANAAVLRLHQRLADAANDPVRVAGLEARYYVRAGLDPRYSTLFGLDALTASIMDMSNRGGDMAFLTRQSRAQIAAAAIAGWVASYADDTGPLLPWHRFIGHTIITVGSGS